MNMGGRTYPVPNNAILFFCSNQLFTINPEELSYWVKQIKVKRMLPIEHFTEIRLVHVNSFSQFAFGDVSFSEQAIDVLAKYLF